MLASAHNGANSEADLDRGPSAARDRAKERLCALTREARPADTLIRFVLDPDNAVAPDIKGKLPGRGLWITATRTAVDEAIKRKVFARGFKREASVAADLGETVDALLVRAALDALAIAGKAGQVVSGFAKVEASLGRGEPVALVHAREAAEDGRRKLDAVLRREQEKKAHKSPGDVTVIAIFSGNQLDLALGRLNVIHAALLAGPVSDTFVARTKRLERFRTGISNDTTSLAGAN